MKLAFLRFCRAIGLFRLAAYINRKKLCILCYHGLAVSGESAFNPKLFMETKTFEDRIESLKRAGRSVLSLDEAAKRLFSGRLPDNTVVITIDDGFHSTYLHAAPLLKARGFPATVYVTTYYSEKGTPIYRLFVRYAFWRTRALSLRESDVIGEFHGEVDLANEKQAGSAMSRIIEYGEARSSGEQAEIARRLGDALGVSYATIEANRALTLMNREEIEKLRDYGVDVQLHTHRHRLPLNRDDVFREIEDNRRSLAPLSTSHLQHLCYPSGEWSPRHWPWLEQAGIATSTTCDHGLNDARTNRFALRRFVDGEDVSSVEFEAALSGFSDWLRGVRGVVYSVKEVFVRTAKLRNSLGHVSPN